MPYSIALKEVSPKEILARYMSGEKTELIAKFYEVSRSQLTHWLITTAETEWKDAQAVRAITRKEAAEDAMDEATDGFALAKSEKQLKAAQWDLERVYKRIYGENVDKPLSNVSIIIKTSCD